jgi:hypothetical protein
MEFLTIGFPISWLFFAHAFAGAIALIVLAIPLSTKKGGKLHVKMGWLYSYAMIFVGLSAFAITPWRIFLDPDRGVRSINFAVFLFYVSAFTLSAIWFGIVALKAKKRIEPVRSFYYIGPPIAMIVLGLATQVVGFKFQNTLLMAFPFLGHFTSKSQLSYWLNPPKEKMHWWYAHMSGMFTACIATITAFLVTALPRIWPGPISQSVVLWIAPGVILGAMLNRWIARDKLRFGD